MRGLAAVIVMCLASGGQPTPDPTPLVPFQQERYVQAQTTNQLEQIPAADFSLFDEFVALVEEHPTTLVRSKAWQRSKLHGGIITARGSSGVLAETTVGDIILGQGVSSVDYSFTVLWQCDYTLLCIMAAEGQLNFPAAAIRLTDPGGACLIDEAVSPGESQQVIEIGILDPGVHRLQVISRSTVMLGLLPASAEADSRFSVLLAANEGCLADLDGDGTVGAADLNLLLAEWGNAPEGPPDFNYDGTVDQLDMNFLLLGWGDCLDDH